MTYRELLIEVMARARWDAADDEVGWVATVSLANLGDPYWIGQVAWERECAEKQIAAAERAGFLIVAPDDGR